MGMYENLIKKDVIRRIIKYLAQGNYYISGKSGLIRNKAADKIIADTPWLIVTPPVEMNCTLLYNILFDSFKKDLGNPPSRCQECWKVVVRPQTLKELFQMVGIQEEIRDKVYGSKSGIERRDYVHGLYGSYFYSRSLEEGIRTRALVEEKVKEHIGDHLPVILKRACTEMEKHFGDSQKWEVTERQLVAEREILNCFEEPIAQPLQPDFVKIHIIGKWIEWAHMYGDKTYLEYVDKPLNVSYRHYDTPGEEPKMID